MRNRHPSSQHDNGNRSFARQRRGEPHQQRHHGYRNDYGYRVGKARFTAEDNGSESFAVQQGLDSEHSQYQNHRPAEYEQRLAREHVQHAQQIGRYYADPLWWGVAQDWQHRQTEEDLGSYAPHAAHGAHSGYGRDGATTDVHSPYGRQSSYGPQDDYSGTEIHSIIARSRMRQKPHRPRAGPKGYVRSDERIREDVCERLMDCHQLDVSDVSVDVEGGKVILQGSVSERWMKHLIEDVADHCPGVLEIDNRVGVVRGNGL